MFGVGKWGGGGGVAGEAGCVSIANANANGSIIG